MGAMTTMPFIAILLAALLGAAAPAPASPTPRQDLANCLGTDRFAADIDALAALRAQMTKAAWDDACRQARDANARRLSLTRVIRASGRSPLGGYETSLRLLGLAASQGPGPEAAVRRQLFLHAAEDQLARESLSRAAARTYAAGLSPTALRLLDALVSYDAVAADAANRAWFETLLDRDGWFDDADADSAAWLIIQHADMDRAFQGQALLKLAALDESQTSVVRLGFLYDRWAAGTGRPPGFGLPGQCADGAWTPSPPVAAEPAGPMTLADWLKLEPEARLAAIPDLKRAAFTREMSLRCREGAG